MLPAIDGWTIATRFILDFDNILPGWQVLEI